MGKVEKHFDVLVIGAGLMGSAAARHLAQSGMSVAVAGPKEPDQKSAHQGVFASHYDQARITRKLATVQDWSRLSSASIERYREIEGEAKHAFFSPVGSVMAGPEHGAGSDFIRNAAKIGTQEGITFDAIRGMELRQRFSYFDFPDGVLALHEPFKAGWINPRDHVAAEIAIAVSCGAIHYDIEIKNVVENHDHVVATCADGTNVIASKVIVACGAFSKADGLLPEPVPIKVFARTITFFELDNGEAHRLEDMPSVVYIPPDLSCDPYILPPVKYADGKTYIKIGGDPDDVELDTIDELKNWFKGNGDENVGAFLADQLLKLMPDLRYKSISTGSCVTSFTKTGRPLIYNQTDRLIALTGGNGASAKCADEIGRLASRLAMDGQIPNDDYSTTFAP